MTITRADGKHVHYDMMLEWINNPTREVQFVSKKGDWIDVGAETAPLWNPNTQYRFKPEKITVTIREALFKFPKGYQVMTVTIRDFQTYEENVQTMGGFIKWLGSVQTRHIDL